MDQDGRGSPGGWKGFDICQVSHIDVDALLYNLLVLEQ
jgi:hypothetical protein